MKLLITSIILILPFFVIGQSAIDYEKNIVVIRDTATYNAQVVTNPANNIVEIIDYIPGIKLDIRYATTNNFTEEKIYYSPKAFVRQPVAKSLLLIQESLKKLGLGLVVFDAYRPYSATVKFYEIYKDTNYVASPWQGSRHNRGAAVDVSLIDLETGEELPMPTGFDDFTEAAHPDYGDLPEKILKNREILINEMQNHGFTVYPYEWWHFDFIGWEAYDLMDLSFEELEIINNK